MANYKAIWKHEVQQANQIAASLLADTKAKLNWKILLLPVFLHDYIRFRKNLRFTRKNLLFTKKLAFEAAKNIARGKQRAWEIRQIEIKTKEILDKEKKGFYTEKIRRKQLPEIELLLDHYLDLFDTNQSKYAAILKAKYESKGNYLTFLSTLHKAEAEVLQASTTSMRKATKKDRREWFQKIKQTTKNVRLAEANKIFAQK